MLSPSPILKHCTQLKKKITVPLCIYDTVVLGQEHQLRKRNSYLGGGNWMTITKDEGHCGASARAWACCCSHHKPSPRGNPDVALSVMRANSIHEHFLKTTKTDCKCEAETCPAHLHTHSPGRSTWSGWCSLLGPSARSRSRSAPGGWGPRAPHRGSCCHRPIYPRQLPPARQTNHHLAHAEAFLAQRKPNTGQDPLWTLRQKSQWNTGKPNAAAWWGAAHHDGEGFLPEHRHGSTNANQSPPSSNLAEQMKNYIVISKKVQKRHLIKPNIFFLW